jgi:preprotein translocase subunit SecB
VSEKKEQSKEPGFILQKIYLKDCSYEAPNTPGVFTQQVQPQFSIEIDIRHSALDGAEGLYEVVLPVTVKGETDNGAVFLIEVHQAGVFEIVGIDGSDLETVLEITCPNILLPYARQTVSSLVTAGGFPQLLINPVNFEALYEQRHAATR